MAQPQPQAITLVDVLPAIFEIRAMAKDPHLRSQARSLSLPDSQLPEQGH
jgi:hypothetical protein